MVYNQQNIWIFIYEMLNHYNELHWQLIMQGSYFSLKSIIDKLFEGSHKKTHINFNKHIWQKCNKYNITRKIQTDQLKCHYQIKPRIKLVMKPSIT